MTITLSATGLSFKRWELIKIASAEQQSVIVRIDKNENAVSTQLYPYEEVGWGKFGRWIWFQLLKLEVFLKLI